MANPLQERYAEMLLDKIRSDKHPSTTHMNIFESVAEPRQLAEYALDLIEKLENDPNPSIPMMNRLQRVISGFGR